MRFRAYSNGGFGFKGIDPEGGKMLLPLHLLPNPTGDMDAVTRGYVDGKSTGFDAASILGSFPADRLPGFSGVDIASSGAGVFTLKTTGVAAGSYSKVTVDSKGRVTAGDSLVSGDVPNLSWSKVSDKPTSLSGYGITDVVSLSGGNMTGALSLGMDATASNHLVTKAYVDGKVGGSTGSAFVTGDIIFKSSGATPFGFVRCNGAILSKSVYAGLYAVVGDKYALSEVGTGAGKPWKNLYAFDTNTATTLGAWTTGASLPAAVYRSQAIVTKNRVYLLGGKVGAVGPSSATYTAPINPDGTLGAWTTSDSLPRAVDHSQAIVTKNRVYLLGGYVNDVSSNIVNTAPINPDGTLGAWSTGTSLPARVVGSQVIVTKNRAYLFGGDKYELFPPGGYSSDVYTAPINPDGTLGAWTTGTSLPDGVFASQAIVTNNRVYLLGGSNGDAYSYTTYTAPINPDGTLGTWTTGTSLPDTVGHSQAIVTKKRVYLLGGHSVRGKSTVYTAPVNPDGTLGTWTTSTSLPATVYNSQAIVTKNRVYLLGGSIEGTSATTYTAPITAGLNDYSPFYDGTYTFVDPDNFRLPDLTLTDKPGSYSYIKL